MQEVRSSLLGISDDQWLLADRDMLQAVGKLDTNNDGLGKLISRKSAAIEPLLTVTWEEYIEAVLTDH